MERYKIIFFEDTKEIKNKQDIVDFVKHQSNIELINDPTNILNKKRNILYTQITDRNAYTVFPLLRKKGLRYEKHIKDYYWIYAK